VTPDADALAEMARNRGLKLVRSRVRTPGKPGFGLFGLADASGAPTFGLDIKGQPLADADALADFLRTGEAGDWKASLKAVGATSIRKAPAKPKDSPPPPPEPEPAAPEPPQLREATAADADQLVGLFALLEHRIDAPTVRSNLAALTKASEPVLVLAEGDRVVAACGFTRTVMPQRPLPVGRISILVIAEDRRRMGLGERLLGEAEARLAALGCKLIEVTSHDRLTPAHSFYRAQGYERTSIRFAKDRPSD
jgi:ribosomal protein S18 acetylase RimI-like enzyme